MAQIKHKSARVGKTSSLVKMVGKQVMAKNGKKIGKVGDIQIHPTRLTVEGMWVEKGWIDMPDYIGKNYIKKLTEKGALLKITPFRELIGLRVYDKNMNFVGKVKDVHRSKKTNKLLSLKAKRKVNQNDIVIACKAIKTIDKSVLLNVKVKA